MSFLDALRRWARQLKRDVLALWFARRHPQTPWHAKALGAFVVAYALSPVDLIPDFIPVLGFVDDVILLPGLIWLTLRLLPPQVLADSRDKAQAWMDARRDRHDQHPAKTPAHGRILRQQPDQFIRLHASLR